MSPDRPRRSRTASRKHVSWPRTWWSPTSGSPTAPVSTSSGPCARRTSEIGLVVLTMYAGDEQLFAAMDAGASAFVGKDSPTSTVVSAARQASVAPLTFTCTGLAEAMIRRMSSSAPRLSDRERQVLELLAEGLGVSAIAGRLYLSESTAKSHIGRIYDKLGAANRAQALVAAMRLGLISSTAPTELRLRVRAIRTIR